MTAYVNPLIGAVTYAEGTRDAHGFGKTFPGAATPFGLVQLSPDTITGGDNGSGYSYVHSTLEGFSFTHMSGVGWYGDFGNFLVTPTVGALKPARGTPDNPDGGYRSRISHSTEVAEAGYYAITLDDYDIDKAFTCCRNSVDRFTNGAPGYASGGKGCISETLEHAYSDWCFGRLAELLEQTDLARIYYARSQAYRNLWNDEVRWFRAKDEDGNWLEWHGKTVHGQGCCESNPYQQGWFVPHDIPGLVALMGADHFARELIALFENTPENFLWNDYYNHPNEPVHHVAFLFNEIGMPWQTQKWTRRICANAYGAGPFGLCGNEDVGQMSAWFVLAAMGIHPICPGDGKYQITSPVFNRIEIAPDPCCYPGKTFTIAAANNSEQNIYIHSMKLNGEPLHRFRLDHAEITAGGMLEMEMGPEPGRPRQ